MDELSEEDKQTVSRARKILISTILRSWTIYGYSMSIC
jgi:F0F1-type ATP synthase beta subunit